ncbi:MAG: pilus assembly protein [Beijerinckiaceae bacterium]|nr:pilus assembly protein [Beijerinckiaceae bacterium]
MAALEFALVLPLFMLIFFGVVVFGSVFIQKVGLQQLASEAARASVAGLTHEERVRLATAFLNTYASGYPLLSDERLAIFTQTSGDGSAFTVQVKYDLSETLLSSLGGNFFDLKTLEGKATVQRGGF